MLASELLDALSSLGAPFAMLHCETDIATKSFHSDLDVAVDRAPTAVVNALLEPALEIGLHPVMLWTYDVAGVSTFWCTPAADEGVQLDLSFDPRGLGRYGFRTRPMLDRARPGDRWPVLDDLDEGLYLLRKRRVKGDTRRAGSARSAVLERHGLEAAARRAHEVFGRRAVRSILAALRGDSVGRDVGGAAHAARSLHRVGMRLVRPTGFWVQLAGGDDASAQAKLVASRFDRFLVGSSALELPSSAASQRALWIDRLAPRRWRPHLVVTTGGEPTWPRPDARLGLASDVELTCAAVVRSMEQRVLQRIPGTGIG